MLNGQTLPEILKNNLAKAKQLTYINGEDNERSLSYQALYQHAIGLLHYFQQQNIPEEAKLIILTNDNQAFIDVFWAANLGRIIPVPLAVGNDELHHSKIFNVYTTLDNAYLYTSKKQLERLHLYAEAHQVLPIYEAMKAKTLLIDDITDLSEPGIEKKSSPDDIAFIQFSSGSTGKPKGVVLTHKNIIANVNAIKEAASITAADSTLSWMPLTHDMGIIGFHLTPLLCNISQFIMPTDLFVRRPLLWLEKICEKQATLTASPNFGYLHFLKRFKPEKYETTAFDLSCLRLLLNGAEPISVTTANNFLQSLAPFHLKPTVMLPVYGLAEASLAVSFAKLDSEFTTLHVAANQLGFGQTIDLQTAGGVELVSVGKPVNHCDVRVIDDKQHTMSDNTIGRICIKGDNVTQGYYNAEEINAALIHNGWLDTGDLGFVHNGELYIAGRSKEIIIIHGQNYYPQDLENLFESHPDIDRDKIVVCGIDDKLVAFTVFKQDASEFTEIARSIKQFIQIHSGLEVDWVLPIRKIPKTTSGKIQRFLLAEQFSRGDFADMMLKLQHQTNNPIETGVNAIEKQLLDICNNTIEGRTVGKHDNLFDLGTSSLTLAQLHEQIDALYPEQLDITDFFDYPTVAEIAVVLENKSQ